MEARLIKGATLDAPIPACCSFWRDSVIDGGSVVSWHPRVHAARIESNVPASAWLAYCPACGSPLGRPRVEDFLKSSGVRWDSPSVGLLPLEYETGRFAEPEFPTHRVEWPWKVRSDDAEDAAAVVRALAELAGLSVEAPHGEASVDVDGSWWFGEPSAPATTVVVGEGVDWDRGTHQGLLELAGNAVRRVRVVRTDRGLVRLGPHMNWRRAEVRASA